MLLDRKQPSPSPAPWILSDVCAGITPVIGSVSLLKPKLWRENKIIGRKENRDTALFSPTTGLYQSQRIPLYTELCGGKSLSGKWTLMSNAAHQGRPCFS